MKRGNLTPTGRGRLPCSSVAPLQVDRQGQPIGIKLRTSPPNAVGARAVGSGGGGLDDGPPPHPPAPLLPDQHAPSPPPPPPNTPPHPRHPPPPLRPPALP